MLPAVEEAKRELETAAECNPGPWVRHSLNVGIAARNIAEKVPELDEVALPASLEVRAGQAGRVKFFKPIRLKIGIYGEKNNEI